VYRPTVGLYINRSTVGIQLTALSDGEHGRGTGRARALRVARRLFTERGYEATSIQDVLDASELSRGALYHHFANKAELFAAVLEDVEAELFARLAAMASEATSAKAALRLGALGFLQETLDPTVRRIVLTDAPAVLGWARWREIDAHYAFGALRAGLQSAIDTGELQLDPDLTENYAHILLAALMEMSLLIANSDQPQAAQARAARSIDRLLANLWNPAP
jgi:AcrR family transcriptional regulator